MMTDMDDHQRAVRVVATFIEKYRMYLTDGSNHGLHARAKEGLIAGIVDAFAEVRGSLPPATVRNSLAHQSITATSKKRPKKVTLDEEIE